MNTVSPDTEFNNPGLLLVGTTKHKLNVYSLDTFELIDAIDVQSNISAIHVVDPIPDKSKKSIFVAVCGQSAGKTTNVRIKKTKNGFKIETSMYSFEKTSKPV